MKNITYSKEHARFLLRRKKNLALIWTLRIGVLGLLLGLWELVTACGWVDPFIMSSPSRIAKTIASLYADGSLFYHIGVTLWETLRSQSFWDSGSLCFFGGAIHCERCWSPTSSFSMLCRKSHWDR